MLKIVTWSRACECLSHPANQWIFKFKITRIYKYAQYFFKILLFTRSSKNLNLANNIDLIAKYKQ